MAKYLVQVTESVNHQYEIEADSEEEALEKYHNLTNDELTSRDLDGQSDWEPHPWDVSEL